MKKIKCPNCSVKFHAGVTVIYNTAHCGRCGVWFNKTQPYQILKA